MKRTIQVLLGNEARPLGTLHFDAVGTRQRAAFEYAESWLRSADRFALDPTLPLVAGPQFHPKSKDGWARRVILRDHAKRRQQARAAGESPPTSVLNDMDFLLAVDDASRVGALRFRDEQDVFCRATEPGRRTVPPLIELGRLLAATQAVERKMRRQLTLPICGETAPRSVACVQSVPSWMMMAAFRSANFPA